VRALWTVVLALSLTLVSAAGADAPTFAATGGDLVVFVGNVGLYDVNPSSGAVRQMSGGNDAYSVSFSRDGTRMLFMDGTTPVVADGDGRNAEPLDTDGPIGDPKLSPDGTKIAFIRDGALFVRALRDPGSARQLTAPTGATDNFPDWAPSGDRILVGRWYSTAGTTLEIVGAGGGEQQWIHNGIGIRYPDDGTWSPDGSQLATLEAGGVDNGGYHITLWNLDGGNPRPITPNRSRPAFYGPPVWSPDGQTLAFYNWENDRVDLVGADGANLRTIFTAAGEVAGVTWRPRGSGVTLGLRDLGSLVARKSFGVSGTVRSIGSEAASQVTVTISATNGKVARATLDGSLCARAGSTATCSVAAIAGDTDLPLSVVVTPGKAGRATVNVSVAAANDAQHDDDASSVTTTVSSCTVLGTVGNDHLTARGGDIVCGLDGNDVIRARNGKRDVIDGGPGSDTAVVDRIDVVRHVEHVKRP